jgi:hypothetical protein
MPYANPEEARARKKAYREKNREKLRLASLAYYHENKLILAEKRRLDRESRPDEIHARDRGYYAKRRLSILASKADYHVRNRAKILEYQSAYRSSHKELIAARESDRIKNDPIHRLKHYTRSRIRIALKGNRKSGRTPALLGCSIAQLVTWLESQFRPGMTWDNYGPVWHVDHKRPCASFDLADPEQQKACFNYQNLQPLFAEENLSKHAKLILN